MTDDTTDTDRRILAAVATAPGATVAGLAAAAGVSRDAAIASLARLLRARAVTLDGAGWRVVARE